MRIHTIILLFFIGISVQTCVKKEPKIHTVEATALLQYFLPNVQNSLDCFANTTTFTKSFIEDKTEDDFFLGYFIEMSEKKLVVVDMRDVKIKFVPNANNQAATLVTHVETGGYSYIVNLVAGEEVSIGAELQKVLEKAFFDALVQQLDVSLEFKSYGCSDDGSQIDGLFKVTLLYDVLYQDKE